MTEGYSDDYMDEESQRDSMAFAAEVERVANRERARHMALHQAKYG